MDNTNAKGSKMDARKAIIIARKHIGAGSMESSARLCLADAVRLADDGDLPAAKARALRSIQFSVGMFHADFVRASK